MIGLILKKRLSRQATARTARPDTALSKARVLASAVVLAALLAFLAACTPVEVALIGGTSTVTYMEEGKTLPDKVLSGLFGKDCAFSYYGEIDKLCKEVDIKPQAPIYCYPSLGRADCYSHPNPYDTRTQPIGGMAQQKVQKKLYNEYLRRKRNTLIKAPKPLPPPTFLQEEADPFTSSPPEMTPEMAPQNPMMNEPSGYLPQKAPNGMGEEMVEKREVQEEENLQSTSLAEAVNNQGMEQAP